MINIVIHPLDSFNSGKVRSIANSIGVPTKYSNIDINLCLTDATLGPIFNNTNAIASTNSYSILVDRLKHVELEVPIVPSTLISKPEDIFIYGNIPVYTKTRNTILKPDVPLNYKHWDTPEELYNSLTDEFWQYQNSTDNHILIQPSAGMPTTMYMLEFTVNTDNIPFVYLSCKYNNLVNNSYMTHMNTGIELSTTIINTIEKICKSLNITSGIHNAQFIELDNELKLMEWTPRPSIATVHGFLSYPGTLERGLQHMLGMPVDIDINNYLLEQRVYTKPFSENQKVFARRNSISLREIPGVPIAAFYYHRTIGEIKRLLDEFERYQ